MAPLLQSLILTSALRSAGMGAAAFLSTGGPVFVSSQAWSHCRPTARNMPPWTRSGAYMRCNLLHRDLLARDRDLEASHDKSAVQRRQFAAQLLSALTSGTAPVQYPDSVHLWLDPPWASPDEQAALEALCLHALRSTCANGTTATNYRSRHATAASSTGLAAAGTQYLGIQSKFLSAPFDIPAIGSSRKCQLCRGGGQSRALEHPDLESFFKKLFMSITETCSAQGYPVSLSPYDLFHGHLVLKHEGVYAGRLMALFHIREYPKFDTNLFPFHLGHCQEV